MKNGDHAIGLFQGLFDKNILTFNPGWSSDAQQLREFTDVRELQRQLKDRGVNMIVEADESSTRRFRDSEVGKSCLLIEVRICCVPCLSPR